MWPCPGAAANRAGALTGSAPDIAGKGIANPIGTILSVAMMLRYSLNLPAEALLVEQAVRETLDAGHKTPDLGGQTTTSQMGDLIVDRLAALLAAAP